jgi:hypothetical protein
MLTYRNTEITTIDKNTLNVSGNEVTCTWSDDGSPCVAADQLRSLRDAALANWSDEEIADLAYKAEARMLEAYTRAYIIGVCEGYNQDQWVILDSIRVENDDQANAYAEANFSEYEWYIRDADGNNING